MATRTRLTDTQLVILNCAAQRRDGQALPVSKDLKTKESVISRALSSLVRRGFLAETPAKRGNKEWRRDEEDRRLTLEITSAGLAAIGVSEVRGSRQPLLKERKVPSIALRPGTKGAAIAALLGEDRGATLAELMQASGWQAHSVRGFLSGALKKRLGVNVATTKGDDGERRYYITS